MSLFFKGTYFPTYIREMDGVLSKVELTNRKEMLLVAQGPFYR